MRVDISYSHLNSNIKRVSKPLGRTFLGTVVCLVDIKFATPFIPSPPAYVDYNMCRYFTNHDAFIKLVNLYIDVAYVWLKFLFCFNFVFIVCSLVVLKLLR